jgi:hypothetical protein
MDETNVEVKTTVGELKKFAARELEIYGFPGLQIELDIQPYAGTDIEVFLTGSPQALLLIHTALLEWKGSVVIKRNETAREETNGEGASKDAVKILVHLPKGAPVKLYSFYGNATIGDIESSVHVNIAKGHASLGEVTHAFLQISEYGDIVVEKVRGSVTIRLAGFGNIHVKGGYTDSLEANINGAGEILFDGEAINSILSVAGAGEIYIAKVRNPPGKKEIRGLGKISIGNYTAIPAPHTS